MSFQVFAERLLDVSSMGEQQKSWASVPGGATEKLYVFVMFLRLESFMERREEFLSCCDPGTERIPAASVKNHISLRDLQRAIRPDLDMTELEYCYLMVEKHHYPQLWVCRDALLAALRDALFQQEEAQTAIKDKVWNYIKSKLSGSNVFYEASLKKES